MPARHSQPVYFSTTKRTLSMGKKAHAGQGAMLLYVIVSYMKHMYQKENNTELRIILVLLSGRIHLRGIARAIDTSPSTVMRVLDGLKSKNVLDYAEEGKNKVYFIKKTIQARLYVYMAENYKLTLLISKYPKLGVIIKEILDKTDKRLVILFGSYASFTATSKSDIDVYIEGNELNADLNEISSMMSPKFGKFDIHSPLIKEIIRTHVILYGVEDFYEKTGFFE